MKLTGVETEALTLFYPYIHQRGGDGLFIRLFTNLIVEQTLARLLRFEAVCQIYPVISSVEMFWPTSWGNVELFLKQININP